MFRHYLRWAFLHICARLLRVSFGYRTWPRRSGPLRILVVRPDHLGDLLFVTPALRLLRQRYPKAHITALVGPWGAPILAHNPHIDRVMKLPFPGFTRQPKPSLWQPYILLYRWAQFLRQGSHDSARSGGGYDVAFVLRFDHWWGALLVHLAGIPERVGYALPLVAPFLTQALPYVVGKHEAYQNIHLVTQGLFVPSSSSQDAFQGLTNKAWGAHPLEFQPAASARAWASAILSQAPAVAIHPGAGAAVKLWHTKGWAAVADVLAREIKAQIFLTGSQAESAMCEAIANRMQTPARIMAGRTNLDQLAALFEVCRLVLGPDSGPLHLAVAMGTPSVHLYGPVDVVKFGPWGSSKRHRTVVSAWPCIPCDRLDYAARDLLCHPCVREIRIDQVLDAARGALQAFQS